MGACGVTSPICQPLETPLTPHTWDANPQYQHRGEGRARAPCGASSFGSGAAAAKRLTTNSAPLASGSSQPAPAARTHPIHHHHHCDHAALIDPRHQAGAWSVVEWPVELHAGQWLVPKPHGTHLVVFPTHDIGGRRLSLHASMMHTYTYTHARALILTPPPHNNATQHTQFDFYRKIPLDLTEATWHGGLVSLVAL